MNPDQFENGYLVSQSSPETRNIRLEAARLVGVAGNFAILLALASHLGSDPSLTTLSISEEIHNWMGRLGAIVSDLLFQLAGIAAFSLPICGFFMAVRAGRTLTSIRASILSLVGILVSLATLSELLLGKKWGGFPSPHPGGIVGLFTSNFETYIGGTLGAFLLSFLFLTISVMLQFPRMGFSKIARAILSRVILIWFAKGISRLFQSIFGAIKRLLVKKKVSENLIEPKSAESISSGVSDVSDVSDVPNTMDPNSFDSISEPSVEAPKELLTIGEINKVRHQQKRSFRKLNRDFRPPSVNMLSGKAESRTKSVDKSWYIEKSNILVQKLHDFGVEGEVTHISPGPVITVYEFKPASGVKIKEIANLSDDLTLALSVLSVRIVAPIPGKPVVGIEIPSPHRETVFFKDLLGETPFFKDELKIPIALGRLASGEPVAADLATMPHLLIAGTTGTGKSVFINTLITSLLFRFTPKELKLILVDPKMVELSMYEDIPHLLLPVVVDSKKAALALRWAVEEMERRYTLLHQLGVRHIDLYNERLHEFQKSGAANTLVHLPYIVVVIDEYADLMAVVPKDVELSIARLAQKARASGIHLVLATQRPSTDVVTGTIKANFPSRISFRVASSVDSKTILDRSGAERLLGQGDLLFHSAGFTSLKRMQGPYISDVDIDRVVAYLKSQGAPEYDEGILRAQESLDDLGDSPSNNEEGELYDRALRLVTEKGEASISLIQRHLRIGYNRAATLMEELEKNGVVAQHSSGTAKRRAVIPQAL